MSAILTEEENDCIKNLETIIENSENKEQTHFKDFCNTYGFFDNFVSFKKAVFSFREKAIFKILSTLIDDQYLISFWLEQGFFHESLLKEFQQRYILKNILFKIRNYLIDYYKN